MAIGVGPFDLDAGVSQTVGFAYVAGADEADFLASAAAVSGFVVADETGPESVTEHLSTPAPNPAANTASVTLTLDAIESVRVTVLDILGRVVAVLHDGPAAAGVVALEVDVQGLTPGTYVIRAEGETFGETQTFTVAR
ncbi:T9SS type A sorting domain-containing protein [Rubrivirga sp.]|uniref:T9SS type A sorting domain-containing protein n=1 Tax=Rubrivirga sp. TaxID=1885344 RepID=UPI003C72D0F4